MNVAERFVVDLLGISQADNGLALNLQGAVLQPLINWCRDLPARIATFLTAGVELCDTVALFRPYPLQHDVRKVFLKRFAFDEINRRPDTLPDLRQIPVKICNFCGAFINQPVIALHVKGGIKIRQHGVTPSGPLENIGQLAIKLFDDAHVFPASGS